MLASTSWATVCETLRTHQISTVVLPTDGRLVLRIRRDSTPEPAHRELYQKLGISSEIIPPRKTWSNAEEGSTYVTKICASHVFSIPRLQKCGSWVSHVVLENMPRSEERRVGKE